MTSVAKQTYAQRAAKHTNPAARALLETIERKRTNLCVSVDVTKQADFLRIIDTVGPYICLVKVGTHIVTYANACLTRRHILPDPCGRDRGLRLVCHRTPTGTQREA